MLRRTTIATERAWINKELPQIQSENAFMEILEEKGWDACTVTALKQIASELEGSETTCVDNLLTYIMCNAVILRLIEKITA